jgi:hypothetical protein
MDYIIIDDSLASSVEVLRNYESRAFADVVCTPEETKRQDEGPTEPDTSSDDEDTDVQEFTSSTFYDAFVRRSESECARELAAPQRSLMWLDARKHCITASNFGAAVGHNKYMSPDALVVDKLWNVFKGNAFTAYGTFHEPDAAASLKALLNGPLRATLDDIYGPGLSTWDLQEVGLLKHHEVPWMAVSPDGIIKLNGSRGPVSVLVEYKCPARLRHTEGHPYATTKHCVPEYYMDQVQGIMGLLNTRLKQECLCALFVVWQPLQLHVTRVPFEKDYYSDVLFPALRAWYFKKYLPMAVLKANNQLVPGTTTGAPVIVIDNK